MLAPLLSFGALYMFGWMAIVGMLLLIACVVVFSSRQAPNPPSQMEDSTLSSYGVATTRAAKL